VLESEYMTLLIGSEYILFLNPSLWLTYTTTRCYIHLVGRVNFLLVFKNIILLEKVCVVSCSLEAFWFCYSVLKSPGKIIKKIYSKKKQKRGKKARRQHRRGFVYVFFSFVWWRFLITMVSRRASLAQSSLGPAYHCH
jgi:hypothetical protein